MNLQDLNVTELSAQEVQDTDGGNPLLLYAIGWFVYETLDNLSDVKKSARDGFNAATN